MLGQLTTEGRNPASMHIDALSTLGIVQTMNAEDATVAAAVGRILPEIARAIDLIVDRLRQGGRLIYVGAGTSGRLGVLDAAECPPTFNTPPGLVLGLIAGGRTALTQAVEGAEDDEQAAMVDLVAAGVTSGDVVVGIASSGRTPYVIAALRYARSQGAATIGFACNLGSPLEPESDVVLAPVVGPEILTGSTRLKSGTATKMVLNMLSTGTMIRLGKTYENLMVDLRATNAKLLDRSRRIVMALTGLDEQRATERLSQCGGEVKTAIVATRLSVSPNEARQRLVDAEGHLRRALESGQE